MANQQCNGQSHGGPTDEQPCGESPKSCCSANRWFIIILIAAVAVLFWINRTNHNEPQMGGESAMTPLAIWVGKPAPDFTAKDAAGNIIQGSQLRGRPAILNFFATWCPPCNAEIPHFVELRKTIPLDQLMVIGFSDETPAELSPFVKEHQINYPILSSEKLPPPYSDITSIPTTFFIDSQGVIQNVLVGYLTADVIRKMAMPDKKTESK